mgnify:CR=1 FL=1
MGWVGGVFFWGRGGDWAARMRTGGFMCLLR